MIYDLDLWGVFRKSDLDLWGVFAYWRLLRLGSSASQRERISDFCASERVQPGSSLRKRGRKAPSEAAKAAEMFRLSTNPYIGK